MAFIFSKFQVAAAKRAALSIKQIERQRESMAAKLEATITKVKATEERIAELNALNDSRKAEIDIITANIGQLNVQAEQFNAPFITAYGMTAEQIANGMTEPVVEQPAEAEPVDDNWPNNVIGYAAPSSEEE